jgi:16S rRNA (guanine966-N2)-methyltransferase
MFDLLGPLRPDARVLDLYAGTGALGIEALSRGAAHATFVEAARRPRAVLERNLAELGLTSRGRVVAGSAASAAAFASGPFDLVLCDPPYGTPLAPLARAAAGALAPGGVLVLEHAAGDPAPEPPESLALWKARRYGGTTLTLYARDPEAAA